MSDVSNNGYTGPEDPTTSHVPYNALSFLVDQKINKLWTVSIGLVKSVSGGGPGAGPPTISVQPMVNQVDGQGKPTPHGIVNNVPTVRLGGGANGIVIDPIAGDIGLLLFASQDISSVKNNKSPSNPGSFRSFAPSDAIYLGTLLSAAPKNFMQFDADGNLNITVTKKLTITANGTVFSIESGKITLDGKEWETHIHSGVSTGSDDTGPPA